MSNQTAINIKNISKDFHLPHQKVDSLKDNFVNLFRTSSGKTEMQHALKNISFEVKKGEFFGIVGRNGSGKSTLLKIIAEIYQPSEGKLERSGKLVPFIELGVGFNPELTGRENIYLNGALLGFSTREVDEMYDEIVEFAELERFMDQKLKNYSSGMQVRLAFSVATRAKADILLIDEVLAVGDADFQRKCFNYFKELKNSEVTVIFVSHDMNAIREYCDRAALIDKSEIVEVGDPEKVSIMYSKLFMDHHEIETTQGDKWGNESIDITNPVAKILNTKVILSYELTAKDEIKEGIYGFGMKDAQGQQLVETNSRINNDSVLNLKKNQKVRISHEFSDVFSDGDYKFDIAVLDEDGITVLCWWHAAAYISIKKEKQLSSILDYHIETHKEKINV